MNTSSISLTNVGYKSCLKHSVNVPKVSFTGSENTAGIQKQKKKNRVFAAIAQTLVLGIGVVALIAAVVPAIKNKKFGKYFDIEKAFPKTQNLSKGDKLKRAFVKFSDFLTDKKLMLTGYMQPYRAKAASIFEYKKASSKDL